MRRRRILAPAGFDDLDVSFLKFIFMAETETGYIGGDVDVNVDTVARQGQGQDTGRSILETARIKPKERRFRFVEIMRERDIFDEKMKGVSDFKIRVVEFVLMLLYLLC